VFFTKRECAPALRSATFAGARSFDRLPPEAGGQHEQHWRLVSVFLCRTHHSRSLVLLHFRYLQLISGGAMLQP